MEKSINGQMIDSFLGEVAKLKVKNKKLTQKLESFKSKAEVYKGKYEECLEIITNNHYSVYPEYDDLALNSSRDSKKKSSAISAQRSPLNRQKMSLKVKLNPGKNDVESGISPYDFKKKASSPQKVRASNSGSFKRELIRNTSIDGGLLNHNQDHVQVEEIEEEQEKSYKSLTETQTKKLKKLSQGSNNLNLIFNKYLKTDREDKVLKDLDNLARGFCKALNVGTTEICIVDDEILDLLDQTEKM